MKKIISILTITLLLMSFKTILTPPDYRDAYVGNYLGKAYYRYANTDKTFLTDSSTYTINVAKSSSDSIIIITTYSGILTVKLINNRFKGTTQRCYGKFSGDSIYVTSIPSSAPMAYHYKGKK